MIFRHDMVRSVGLTATLPHALRGVESTVCGCRQGAVRSALRYLIVSLVPSDLEERGLCEAGPPILLRIKAWRDFRAS